MLYLKNNQKTSLYLFYIWKVASNFNFLALLIKVLGCYNQTVIKFCSMCIL